VVDPLPSKFEALSSNPPVLPQKKKKRERERRERKRKERKQQQQKGSKLQKDTRTGGVTQAVQHLLSKH
jgi:hypothetical protein